MQLTMPDVTAYRLDEAVNLLQQKEISFFFEETRPACGSCKDALVPAGKRGVFRVLKQVEVEPRTLKLIIAAEFF